MAETIDTINFHPDYELMRQELQKIKDAVEGSFKIKSGGTIYLDKPSTETTVEQYSQYKKQAEYDEIPNETLRSNNGKLQTQNTEIELPESIGYLVENSNGDGLSLAGLANSSLSNVQQFKWHLLVADFKGLTDADLENVSEAQYRAGYQPKATINEYDRCNVVDWHFDRINGAMQLSYVLLREVGDASDNNSSFVRNNLQTISYIKLCLDEEGNYYQQKAVEKTGSLGGKSAGYEEGERHYITVNDEPLNYLPVEIVSDEEFISGDMPTAMGILSPVCDLSIYRYQVSAEYKTYLRKLIPTMHVMGISDSAWKQFELVNGRSCVLQGEVNLWPTSGTEKPEIMISGADGTLQQYLDYFEKNEREIRAQGGVFPSDDVKQRTATEVISESADNMARFGPMVDSCESGIRRCLYYCGMFEGVYDNSEDGFENAMEDITFKIPRDFSVRKLTPEERKAIRDDFAQGLIPEQEALRMLEAGGALKSTIEQIVDEKQQIQ